MTKSEFNAIARNSFRAYFAPLVAFLNAIKKEWNNSDSTQHS